MNPNKNKPTPAVSTYKLPWIKLIFLGLFMELGVFVAPILVTVFGWNIAIPLVYMGGWPSILAISNFCLGIIALRCLRKWYVPYGMAVATLTLITTWALEVSLSVDNDILQYATLSEDWLSWVLLVSGPVLSLGIALIAYTLPRWRKPIVGVL